MFGLEINFLIFAAAFYILIKSADYFVEEAANLGKVYGMSKIMIGLTIVAIGTSLPETITALSAAFFSKGDYSEFIIGTLMGSNITNILLAFGLFLIIAKNFTIHKKEIFNVISLLLTSLALIVFTLIGYVNYFAILLFLFYLIYIYYLKKFQKKEYVQLEEEVISKKIHNPKKSYMILFFSFLGLFGGAKLVIFSVENVGRILVIPTAYLTLTTISIATSLPEIAVTFSSAKKKEYLIGIGNILGTNVMNVGLILGLSGFFGFYTINTLLYIESIIFFILATIIFSIMIIKRKFPVFVGYGFILLYFLYLLSFLI